MSKTDSWRWQVAQRAELQWWQSYLDGKEPEVYLSWKRDYWQNFIAQSELTIPTDAHILDAGCGPAGIFTVLPDNPVVALDPLHNQYTERLPHFQPADYPNVQFVSTPLETYRTTDQFDLIFCLNAINHVADMEAALDSLIAPLATGGTLALSIDAHKRSLLKHIFRALPGDILHPQQHDLTDYHQALTSRGLSVERSILLKEEAIFDYYLLLATKC